MASFETDLARYLAANDREADAAEANESYFNATMPWWEEVEDDTLVSYWDMLDPASPAVHIVAPHIVRLNPGCDGEFEPFDVERR